MKLGAIGLIYVVGFELSLRYFLSTTQQPLWSRNLYFANDLWYSHRNGKFYEVNGSVCENLEVKAPVVL